VRRQDAPRTRSGHFSVYDTIATEYDDIARPSPEDRLRVQKTVTDHFTDRPPRTLDVGSGTGALLDMKITTPDLFTGIDPSQGMLNELVRKHPEVKDLRPCRVEDVLSTLEPGSLDLVTALFGSASYLTPAAIEHLWQVTGRVMVLMHFDELPGYLEEEPLHEMLITHKESRAATRALGGRVVMLGGYQLTVIEKDSPRHSRNPCCAVRRHRGGIHLRDDRRQR
jgi:SAM-dependent methyltransferase